MNSPNEPDGLTKRCSSCQESLHYAAKKCPKCQAHQTWRRYLETTQTTLALLVALIAVVTVGANVLTAAVKELLSRDEKVIVSVAGADETIMDIVVHNESDDAFGILKPEATVRSAGDLQDDVRISTSEDRAFGDYFVKPLEIKSFVIRDAYQFLRSATNRDCYLDYTVKNPRNDTERTDTASFPCPLGGNE